MMIVTSEVPTSIYNLLLEDTAVLLEQILALHTVLIIAKNEYFELSADRTVFSLPCAGKRRA